MIPASWFLILSAVLFLIGVLGFFLKRNIIALLLSVEIMLNAVNLTFVVFSNQHRQISGQIFVFFVLVVANQSASRFQADDRPLWPIGRRIPTAAAP